MVYYFLNTLYVNFKESDELQKHYSVTDFGDKITLLELIDLSPFE